MPCHPMFESLLLKSNCSLFALSYGVSFVVKRLEVFMSVFHVVILFLVAVISSKSFATGLAGEPVSGGVSHTDRKHMVGGSVLDMGRFDYRVEVKVGFKPIPVFVSTPRCFYVVRVSSVVAGEVLVSPQSRVCNNIGERIEGESLVLEPVGGLVSSSGNPETYVNVLDPTSVIDTSVWN